MNKIRIFLILTALLTAGSFAARSQSAVNTADSVAPDTLKITPSMVEAINDSRRVVEFSPDIESNTFIPKGQWLAGVSVSYTQSNQNKYQFLILENLSGDTYSFKISPMLGYAVKKDMVIGLKFAYQRSLTKLESLDFVLDSETSMSTDHLYSLGHNYYATPYMRNYFSLGSSKRFGFFNEIQLQLGGGQSKVTRGTGDSLTGAYETNFSLDIGIVPGLIMFLSNWSAIEVNVGVLGFSYHYTKSISDQIYYANRHSKSANFRINLLSITFGTTFYL